MNITEKIIFKMKREGLIALSIAIVLYPFRFARRLRYKKMLQTPLIKDRFSEIYNQNFWNSKESASGEGSEIEYTQPLREWLINIVPKLEIKVFVDAPCGDFNWMKEVLPSLSVNYIGLDIVSSVIEKNQKAYSANNIRFNIANICEDTLPKCDLIMVRDCLFHLSYEDINHFFLNLARLDYKYLLTTTHLVEENFQNADITTGDFRIIDLFSDPFNFNKINVKDRVNDYPKGHIIPREMILVQKKHVPKSINLYSK